MKCGIAIGGLQCTYIQTHTKDRVFLPNPLEEK